VPAAFGWALSGRNIMSPFALKPAAVPGTPLNRLSTLFTGPACLLDKS
jgi:hypothetical protein